MLLKPCPAPFEEKQPKLLGHKDGGTGSSVTRPGGIQGSPGRAEADDMGCHCPSRGGVVCHLVRAEDCVERVRTVHVGLVRQCRQNRRLEALPGFRRVGLQAADDGQAVLDPDAAAGDRVVENGYFHEVIQLEGCLGQLGVLG
ncbi:hypothetical protein E5206_13865 [Arthrobacter sp. PAMC25564]|nr:hypothetical protein E5206_13865 [Arthrobacter sp. PAMC25564]